MKPCVRDALLVITAALPVGATTTKPAAGLDVGPSNSQGNTCPEIDGELLLEVPALTTVQLPDTKTITYDLIASDNADLSSAVVIRAGAIVQTGAGGAGAAANQARHRPATDAKRYWGYQSTGVATVAAGGSSASLSYVS